MVWCNRPTVMKLEGLVTSRFYGNLHLIFTYMIHDLSGLVMQQLHQGLEHCHSPRRENIRIAKSLAKILIEVLELKYENDKLQSKNYPY